MAKVSMSAFDSKAFLTAVSQGRGAAHYGKDSVVYRQAAIADAVYYLQDGRIKISVSSAAGKEAVIAILEAGAFFGEGCLIGHTRRSATAIAMTDSEVVRLGKAEMLRVLHEDASFGEVFIQHLLSRNSRVEDDLVDQLFNSSEKRLARALLLLAHVQRGGGPQPITTKLSHETLAELIGTTRPRVSHFMTKFRRLGFISCSNGNLQIHNSLMNVCDVVHTDPRPHDAVPGPPSRR
jgi:CRP/FNR family cyclic AMP-dependent transcriptional regulator